MSDWRSSEERNGTNSPRVAAKIEWYAQQLRKILADARGKCRLCCAVAGRGRAVRRKRVVRLPADGPEYATYDLLSLCDTADGNHCSVGAHQFFMHFVPGLIHVAAGDLKLVGVPPRTAEEVEAPPRDWRQLYLGSFAGLITEAYVMHGDVADPDMLYSAEVFYAATAGPSL